MAFVGQSRRASWQAASKIDAIGSQLVDDTTIVGSGALWRIVSKICRAKRNRMEQKETSGDRAKVLACDKRGTHRSDKRGTHRSFPPKRYGDAPSIYAPVLKISSRRSRKIRCPLTILSRATARVNHSARSTSGKLAICPLLGRHSISKASLLMLLGTEAAYHGNGCNSFPSRLNCVAKLDKLAFRTKARFLFELLIAAACAVSSALNSPLGMDQLLRSLLRQKGPPGWTSRTIGWQPKKRYMRIPALRVIERLPRRSCNADSLKLNGFSMAEELHVLFGGGQVGQPVARILRNSATWADYCAKTRGLPYCRTSSSLERSAILRLSRFTDLHGSRRKNEQFLGAVQCLTAKRASASVAPGTRCGTLSSLRAAPPAHAACTSTPLRRQAARPTAARRSRSGCMPFREPPRGR